MRKQLYAGIDLHSNNLVVATVDQSGKRLGHRRLPCSLNEVLEYLNNDVPGKIKEIAVESTYNWYWLVDGLKDAGYRVKLANPAGMVQYNGLKAANDKTDAYFIAELLRLGIMPCGHGGFLHGRSGSLRVPYPATAASSRRCDSWRFEIATPQDGQFW